jgi:hypothetical protein
MSLFIMTYMRGLRHLASFSTTEVWPVPVPYSYNVERSLETQRRIVARIEALMAEVKKARTLLEQMRRDADLLMKSALAEVIERLDKHSQESPTLHSGH